MSIIKHGKTIGLISQPQAVVELENLLARM